jgi:hypothetical protein
MFLLTRLFAILTAALFSLGVAKAGSEISPQAVVTDPPPTTIAEPFGNPLIIQDLNADWSSSEEWIPQVPELPAGITLEPAPEPEPPTVTEINGGAPETTVPLPVWEGSIPEVYGEGSGCSQVKANIIARELWDRGATDDTVYKMLRIISRESLCDSSAHNGNRNTGDDSWGLCQQNNLSGWFDEGKLLENYDRFAFADDFALNAESCAVMWAECSVGPWNYGNYYCSTPRELR